MAGEYHRVLFVFVDGIGLAAAAADNPFASVESPVIEELLGGRLTIERCGLHDECALLPLDAQLGIDGLPQSATGQATLFTGVNAALEMGRHVTGFPGPRLRKLVVRHGLLAAAKAKGLSVTFANAYSDEYLDRLDAGDARPSVTTCLVRAARLPFRTLRELREGQAASWDIVGDLFGRGRAGGGTMAQAEPRIVGQRLALLAGRHDLTLYETFLPDLVGHRRAALGNDEVIRRLDGLMAGILDRRDPRTTVVLCSDHGNFESVSVRTHTSNPVPLLIVGPGALRLDGQSSIADVTPLVLDILAGAPAGAST